MTTARRAKSFINYYTPVASFCWNTCSEDTHGMTITFGLLLQHDIWHYIGIVVSERKNEGVKTFIPVKSVVAMICITMLY